ncbi:MAG TPA: hypothetical protein VJU18_00740 [Vicinamibacteria bacterium]|nr:hypothetical protein [Vicinamibacteria bacterium]
MKYLQDGSHQQSPLMRLSLGLTLALLLAFWITNLGMYFSRMDLTPASVAAYYNGSETDFRPPRSLGAMLETAHMHLPMMALLLLVLTHLLIFVPLPRPAKASVIVAAFVSAVAEEGGGFLVRFVSPALAPVKVAGFLGLQVLLAFLMAALGLHLARMGGRPQNGGVGAQPSE